MFGSEERREQMRNREGRERREQRKWERGERKFTSGIYKILLLFLQYCYSAIPLLELYRSSIVKNLQYLPLAFPDAIHFGPWNAKYTLHMALVFPNANCLRD